MKTLALLNEEHRVLLKFLLRITDENGWLNSKWIDDASAHEIAVIHKLTVAVCRETLRRSLGDITAVVYQMPDDTWAATVHGSIMDYFDSENAAIRGAIWKVLVGRGYEARQAQGR